MIQAKPQTISKAEESILSVLASNGIDSEESAMSLRQIAKLGLNIVTVQKHCSTLADYGLLNLKETKTGLSKTFNIYITELGKYAYLKSITDESYKINGPLKEVKEELDNILKLFPSIKQIGSKTMFYNILRTVVYGTDFEFSYLNNACFTGIVIQLFVDSKIPGSIKKFAITETFQISEHTFKDVLKYHKDALTFSFYYEYLQKIDNEIVMDTIALKHGNNKQLFKDRLKEIKKTRLEIIKIIKNSPELQKINATIGGNYKIGLISSEKEKNA